MRINNLKVMKDEDPTKGNSGASVNIHGADSVTGWVWGLASIG